MENQNNGEFMISNFVAVVGLGIALQGHLIAFMFSNLWFVLDFEKGKVEEVCLWRELLLQTK